MWHVIQHNAVVLTEAFITIQVEIFLMVDPETEAQAQDSILNLSSKRYDWASIFYRIPLDIPDAKYELVSFQHFFLFRILSLSVTTSCSLRQQWNFSSHEDGVLISASLQSRVGSRGPRRSPHKFLTFPPSCVGRCCRWFDFYSSCCWTAQSHLSNTLCTMFRGIC